MVLPSQRMIHWILCFQYLVLWVTGPGFQKWHTFFFRGHNKCPTELHDKVLLYGKVDLSGIKNGT